MVNGALKLKKYIVVGREHIIHDCVDSANDKRKLLTEVYVLRPNTQIKGGWREYDKWMYNEVQTPTAIANGVKSRGRDVGMESGQCFVSVDGTAQDFMDLNFPDTDLETNKFRFIKTYSNNRFMKRDRTTSFHEEYDMELDENGNPYMKRIDKNAPAPAPKVVADFSTIISGTKYLYYRYDLDGEDCIAVCDVNYWLKNDSISDNPPQGLKDDLDSLDSTNVELVEGHYQADDMDAFEKSLKASPDWNEDVNFSKLFV